MINIFRFTLMALFAVCGAICIGIVSLVYFSSGTEYSYAKTLNTSFFQKKADAETDRLIKSGVFTAAQESDIRGFIRRTYVADCTVVIYGMGTGLLSLGVAFWIAAYASWLSYRLSVLQRLNKAGQDAAANL